MPSQNDRPPLPNRLAPRMEATMYGAGAAHATAVPYGADIMVSVSTGDMTLQLVGDPDQLSLLFTDAVAQVDAIQTRGQ